jgi:hypothetical protein
MIVPPSPTAQPVRASAKCTTGRPLVLGVGFVVIIAPDREQMRLDLLQLR